MCTNVADNSTQFDSIDLTKTVNRTLTSLPYMVFTGYEVVNTTAAAENGYLDAGDINSATSKPNAIHSIARDFPTVSNFRSNATALAAINVTEFFDLVSFAVKPLGPAEAYSYMLVDAYEIGSKGIENWHSLALGWGEQTGFLQPVQLEPREYFPGWGEKVNWVEIEARSDDNEPMEFCVDDIVLDFKERTASED